MRDSMYARVNVLGNSPAFDCSHSVCVYSYAGHVPPNTPRASDTVATSGFLRLPLCFTRDRWTAEFGAHGLVTVPSLFAKQ